jgi:hypothetical protein
VAPGAGPRFKYQYWKERKKIKMDNLIGQGKLLFTWPLQLFLPWGQNKCSYRNRIFILWLSKKENFDVVALVT